MASLRNIVGGVISPLLANVYLHYVLDEWFEREVRPRLHGRAFLIRYADDFIMGFACEEDARRVLAVLPKRFGKFGLTLHPDKTRLVDFRRPASAPIRHDTTGRSPGTFDFLGFTHLWGRSRYGRPVVQRRTMRSRFTRGLRRVRDWLRRHLHEPVRAQHRRLCQMLLGHYAYFGVTGNIAALGRYLYMVRHIWRRWLARRRRGGYLSWNDFALFLQRFPLAPPRVVHSVYRS